jgi:serine/threonine-protein kinase RsbT
LEFPVQGGSFAGAGDAASKIKNILKQLGIPFDIIRRVAIASYEAEINIVAYAREGKLYVDILPGEIRFTARDSGPGIPDIEKAMQEGFSTATSTLREMGFGAGMGLPNIKRAADWMQLTSEIDVGTELKFKIFFNEKAEADGENI